MSVDVAAARPGHYVLTVRRTNATLPLLGVGIARNGAATAQPFVLPALQHTDYLVHLAQGAARFSFDDTDVAATTIRPARPVDFLRTVARPRVRRRVRLVVDAGLSLQPLLIGAEQNGKALARSMRALSHWGFGVESANLQRTPELLFDVTHAVAPRQSAPAAGRPPRFVVALHLFYEELWPEFRYFLQRLDQPFDLIVTTPHAEPAFAADARRAFPAIAFVTVPNRGRDVAPFLSLLQDGRFDGRDLVLKLHGKRTALTGYHAALGHVWRRATLLDLAGSAAVVRRIVARFDADRSIGMIGSPRFRLPGSLLAEDAAWGKNRAATLALAERLGIGLSGFRLDYFAGTMFWARRETLEPLKRLNLAPTDFPKERGQRDGELHHALERLFGALPALSGQRLENAPVHLADETLLPTTDAA